MKVFLLHRDRDFEAEPELRDETLDTIRDLELDTLWNAMAAGDDFLFATARRAVLASLTEPEAIEYRQGVLADCLAQPAVVREIYGLALEALENERHAGVTWHTDRPDSILRRAVQILSLQVDVLRRLRQIAEQAHGFRSEGFTRFFAMLESELGDDYLQTVEHHLRELRFKRGVLQSAEPARGNKARRYTVHEPPRRRWTDRLPFGNRPASYSFTIPDRDEGGFRALEEIRAKGINHVANALAQSADHVKSFFSMLRLELAFYVGCLNLHEQLAAKGAPTCFPTPLAAGRAALDAEEIYDVCLSLHLDDRVVGNDVHADGKSLVMITGANQGGKSTLLRSLGLAFLMTQCGMFVGARSLRASVCAGVFTHYKHEEDATMEAGKLDEELSRMSAIAGAIAPRALLLCNESFASTNEREGSAIAREVVRAMVDKRIRVVFVTHMYELAHDLHAERLATTLFLRAEREPDGRRTFKLREGEPLPTSYGEDSYRRIFANTIVDNLVTVPSWPSTPSHPRGRAS